MSQTHITEIVITLSNGQKISMTLDEARSLYKELFALFSSQTFTIPSKYPTGPSFARNATAENFQIVVI